MSVFLKLFLIFFISGTSFSLDEGDFYQDSSATTLATVSGGSASNLNLPLTITNIRGLPEDSAFTTAAITGGLLTLSPPTYHIGLQRRSAGYSGSSTLKFSIDVPLRNRALNDIKAKFPALNDDSIYPTHLLLFEVDDLHTNVGVDLDGTIAQLVLATNGRYTFGIALIVRVFFGTSTFTGSYNDDFSQLLFEYPFATNGVLNSNAATESNVGTPGKYVINFNDALPPPPPCPCKKRLEALTCHTMKQMSGNIPSFCSQYM